jgi:TM2 domain-containing membrane protein YozV
MLNNKKHYLSGLTSEEQTMFLTETGRLHKSETTAFLLTFFLGGIGAHRFYLRQKDLGILYLAFCWTLIPTVAALCELFVISRRVREYNERANREVATALHKYAVPRAGVAAPAAELPIHGWDIHSPLRRSTLIDQIPGERHRLDSQIYPLALLMSWESRHLPIARA